MHQNPHPARPLQIPTVSLQTFTNETATFLPCEGLSKWERNSSPKVRTNSKAPRNAGFRQEVANGEHP